MYLERGPLPGEVVEALDQAWYLVKPDTSKFWHGELEYGYNMYEVLFEREY